jgi:hypothetical protein
MDRQISGKLESASSHEACDWYIGQIYLNDILKQFDGKLVTITVELIPESKEECYE